MTATVVRSPRRLLLVGLAGSVLIAAGGLGAGAVPVDRTWLGLPAGMLRAPSSAVVAVGVLLLVAAWWQLRQVLEQVSPRAVLATAAAWAAPLLVAPPLFSRDVYAYAGQAQVVARGLDPYEVGPGAVAGPVAENIDEVWRDVPSPYGPAFLGPAALLQRLAGDDVDTAVLLLRALAVVGLVLTALTLPVVARACGVPAQRALWLGVANPLGLLHGVAGAHNDALMVGLMVAAVALAVMGPATLAGGAARWTAAARWCAVGGLVALAALVKAPALAALPFLVAGRPTWSGRVAAGVLAGLGAAGIGAAVAAGSGLGWGWLGALDAGRARLSLFSPVTGLATLLGAASGALGADAEAVRTAVLAVGAPAGLLAGAALLLLVPRLGAVRALGLALLAVVALSPTVLPWYVLWGVVPLAAVAGRRTAAALGALCLVLCLTVQPGGRVLLRPPLYGVPLLAAGVVAAVVLRRERRLAGSAA